MPEAQSDRFMLKVKIDYPTKEEERAIIRQQLNPEAETVTQVASITDILKAREVVARVYMDEKIEQYILDIVFATRKPQDIGLTKLKNLIEYGASPRASIALASTAKSLAFLRGRGYVIPEDVRSLCNDVLRHRIGLTYEAEAENVTSEEIIQQILNKVVVP